MFDLVFKSTVETKEPYIYNIYMEGDEDLFFIFADVGSGGIQKTVIFCGSYEWMNPKVYFKTSFLRHMINNQSCNCNIKCIAFFQYEIVLNVILCNKNFPKWVKN